MNFNGKVVLITGAAAGIGAATAIRFAKFGASLALVDINSSALIDMAQKSFTTKPLLITADVTKDVEKIINTTITHYGQLDILVNNAGKGIVGTIETTTLEQFDDIISINVRSVYNLTKLAIPYLLQTKGNIVNVSSVSGVRAFADFTAYSISKAAIDQLTRCVALTLAGRGVRVNAVNPGAILTNVLQSAGMTAANYEKYLDGCRKSHPLGRPGNADEVASGIVYLASDLASFVTGTTMSIDGGRAIPI